MDVKGMTGNTAFPERRILRVAAYIRVSTEHEGQEDSYRNQQEYFQELLAESPFWISAGIYADYGLSGTSKERRRGFNRLLRHCQEGRIDRIVTKSISRFARNTRDFLAAMEILKRHRVTIFFEKEHLDTAVMQNEMILTAFGAIAQGQSQSIAANIRAGIRQRFPRGEARNMAVYGYRYVNGEAGREVMESGYVRRRVEIVEGEARIVRRIYEEAAEGRGFTEIARGLNLDAVPKPESPVSRLRRTRKETPVGTLHPWIEEGWTGRHVRQILRLERYCGDALLQKTFTPDYRTHKSVPNRGELPQYYIEENHPAIVERDVFRRVQPGRKGQRKGEEKKRSYPFSRRVVCARCGRFYVTRNRKNRPVWACASTGRNTGKIICAAERIYEDQLIRACRKGILARFGGWREQGFQAEGAKMREELLSRLVQVHRADEMERDLQLLQQQISENQDRCEEDRQLLEGLQAAGDVMRIRQEAFAEEADHGRMADLAEEICRTEERLRRELGEAKRLEEKRARLLQYWEDLEKDYEWREKAIGWMRTLPRGQRGTEEFLRGFTEVYLKAFVLYIEAASPLRYRIRWFDDTWTDVELYGDEE